MQAVIVKMKVQETVSDDDLSDNLFTSSLAIRKHNFRTVKHEPIRAISIVLRLCYAKLFLQSVTIS